MDLHVHIVNQNHSMDCVLCTAYMYANGKYVTCICAAIAEEYMIYIDKVGQL